MTQVRPGRALDKDKDKDTDRTSTITSLWGDCGIAAE